MFSLNDAATSSSDENRYRRVGENPDQPDRFPNKRQSRARYDDGGSHCVLCIDDSGLEIAGYAFGGIV